MKSPARVENLEELIRFVAGHAKRAGFPCGRVKEVELAAEEALVNIFQYAYPHADGDVGVKCEAGDDGRFHLEISDRGVPFNMLEAPEPDITPDIQTRKIGGLGIFFMKKMADDVRYRREEGNNILTLIFDRRNRSRCR